MCLFVWIGSECPLPSVAARLPGEPDPVLGYHYIEAVAVDAAVARHFTLPYVSYVGSHEGCGCGYNADEYVCAGLETAAEVASLLDALTDDERADYLAGERSRERLRALIRHSSEAGDVEVYGCWSGDEEQAPRMIREVDCDYFVHRVRPIAERVKYVVRGRERDVGALANEPRGFAELGAPSRRER